MTKDAYAKHLEVASNYIKRNKEQLIDKSKQLPIDIETFLIAYAKHDVTIRQLCHEINFDVEDKHIELPPPVNKVHLLIKDIERNKLDYERMEYYQDITLQGITEYECNFKYAVFAYCNKETFEILQTNNIINKLLYLRAPSDVQRYLSVMITCKNESLLGYLMTEGSIYMDKETANDCICRTDLSLAFAFSHESIKLMLKYFPNIPRDILVEILDKAESEFMIEVALFMSKYIEALHS